MSMQEQYNEPKLYHRWAPRQLREINPNPAIQEYKGSKTLILGPVSSLLTTITDMKLSCAGSVTSLVVEQRRAKASRWKSGAVHRI